MKLGYNFQELDIKDCVCVRNNDLIAIVVGESVDSPLSDEILGKNFYFCDGVYHAKQNIKTLLGVASLREKLYENGFVCDGIKYTRWKRSSGSSRVGKCLFIDEKLYKRMHKWEMCGIHIDLTKEIDLAALEAYIALPLSSIIDTLEIDPRNILVIDDYESTFNDHVIAIDEKDGKLRACERNATICNSIFDGQSLISPDIMGKYSDKGFVLLRNRFFKSACFNCNIQKWFNDNGITRIDELNGFTFAESINDIKLITTPSSIKYLKFGKLVDWLKRIDSTFGVVKHEKKTHFFNGRMVQTHYQLLNTLQLSQDEVDELVRPSLEYLKLIKSDISVLRYYIKYNCDDPTTSPARSKNDIVYKMLGVNDQFSKTKLYYDFRQDLTKSFVKNLRCGHILVNGNYSTLLGNPIEMLQVSIGTFKGESQLGVGNIHSIGFPYGIELLGSRSPHVCSSNIWVSNNVKNSLIDCYFNLTEEIVCVNSIGENLLNRLSGSDFDSDSLLLTDDPILLDAAKKNYVNFKVPTNFVSAKKLKRFYSAQEQADLDIKTSVNKIGEIINLSQELNTLLWDKINTGYALNELIDLYYDIAKLDILSMLEIDRAKKEYTINSTSEIKLIKNKYKFVDDSGKRIKPNFFGHVAKQKGYYDPKKKNYKFHQTTMDYLQHSINKFRLPNSKRNYIPFSSILKPQEKCNRPRAESIDRIIKLVRDTKTKINYIWQDTDDGLSKQEKFQVASDLRQCCINYIDRINMSTNSMYWLLKSIESEENKDISSLIFYTLFGAPNKSFYKLIKESIEPINELVESEDGYIEIYNFNFLTSSSKESITSRAVE